MIVTIVLLGEKAFKHGIYLYTICRLIPGKTSRKPVPMGQTFLLYPLCTVDNHTVRLPGVCH